MVREEFEAIESMFPSDCTITTNPVNQLTTITINTPEKIDIQFTFDQGKYPSKFPEKVLFLGTWEQPVGVAFHVEIVKFMSSLALGEPMLFEIYGQAQTMLQTLEELPKLSLSSGQCFRRHCTKRTQTFCTINK